MKTKMIKIHGVEVQLDWGDRSGGRPGERSFGQAIHTVNQADLDDGSAGGPCDGFRFAIEGESWELGQHDYEADGDEVTCTAEIYRAPI